VLAANVKIVVFTYTNFLCFWPRINEIYL